MKTLQEVLRWFIIICVFALPIVPCVVAYSMFFPFITGKNFDFRIIVELMAGMYVALALLVPKYRPRRNWVLLAFTVFVVIMGIADIQGVNPGKSFWSNYERMDGWITIAHLLVFIVVSSSVLTTENMWKRFFQWSLFISAILAILGYMQVLGIAALGQGGASGLEARVDATFGNPIYLAVYMLFHAFIAALLWAQMWNSIGLGRRLWPSLMYGSVIVLDTMALLFSGTRGATLGLIGGAFLALLLFALSSDASKKIKQLTIVLFIILVASAGGLRLAKDTAFVRSVGFLDRLSTIGDGTTVARVINTQIAFKGIAERPILGWGHENFAIVFDKYYDPRMYAQEQWFDRVHNTVLDMWIAGGTLGLLAYLSVFLAALWAMWRTKAFRPIERSILTGLLAGYFVQNLTVFDNVTSWIFFGSILGYIVFRSSTYLRSDVISRVELFSESMTPVLASLGLVFAITSVYFINYPAYAENVALIAALQPPQNVQDLQSGYDKFEKALSFHTFGDQEVREQLAQRAMQVLAIDAVPADMKKLYLDAAIRELDAQSAVSPLDARFPLFAGGVLGSAGQNDRATAYLNKALELSPKKQSILYQLAQNALLKGDTGLGINYFKQAYELDKTNRNARAYYVSALIESGNMQEADAVLAPYVDAGDAASKEITQAYAAKDQFPKLIPIWKAYVEHNPLDKTGYLTLASVYYKVGDRASAVSVLQNLIQAIPGEKSNVEPLIEQVKNGTVKQ